MPQRTQPSHTKKKKKSKPRGFSNAGHSIGHIEWKRASKNPTIRKKKYKLQIKSPKSKPCPVFPKLYIAETLFIKSPKHAKKIETRALLARDAPQWELLGSAQPSNPEHIVKTDPCRPKISKKDYMAPTPTWYIEQVAGPSGMADGTHGEQPCERISDSFSRGAS